MLLFILLIGGSTAQNQFCHFLYITDQTIDMPGFFVDPNIASAQTIHTSFYTDPQVFNVCREKIFARCWHFAGDEDLVREPGQCHPFTLLDKFISEPLVLTRDKENQLHCLSNVCTHRGTIVVNGPCKVSRLRCRYHGRIFKLNGQFQSMPEFEGVANFPSAEDDLQQLPMWKWGKWIFTSLSLTNGHELFFKEMAERLHWLPVQDFVLRQDLCREYYVKAHWALYCENYLEGLHIPFVHPGLNAIIEFGDYQTELFNYSNLQLGIAKDKEDSFDLPPSSVDYGKRIAAYYFWVFPNLMFNFYPWGLSINIVQPVSQELTKVSFVTYVWKEDKLYTGAGSALDKVEREDEEVVEAVQRGIHSRFYEHGRYSAKREQGTHHFHRLITAFLQAT